MLRIIKTLLFFIPFFIIAVFPQLMFPFVSSKRIVFQILVDVIFAAWLIYVWKMPRLLENLRQNKIFLAFLALMVVFFASAVFGLDFSRSFWGEADRQTGIIIWLHLAALFAVLASLAKDLGVRFWNLFMNEIFAIGVFAAISGIMEFFGLSFFGLYEFVGDKRVGGFFGLSSYLALFLAVMIFFSLLLAIRARGKYARAVYVFGAAVEVFTLIITGTRGSIAGFAAGAIIALFYVIFQKNLERKTRFLAVGVFVVCFLVVLSLFFSRHSSFIKNNIYLNTIFNTTLQDNNFNSRLLNWKYSLLGFAEKPVFGSGPENYAYQYGKFIEPKLYRYIGGSVIWFDKPHNAFLEFLATTGISGFIGYLALWFLFLRAVLKKKDYGKGVKAVLLGMAAAYFVEISFLFDTLAPLFIFVVLWAWLGADTMPLKAPISRVLSEKSWRSNLLAGRITSSLHSVALLAMTVIIFFTAFAFYATVKFARAAYWEVQAELTDITKAYPAYQKAISFHSRPVEEYAHKSFLARTITRIADGGKIEDLENLFVNGAALAKEAKQNYSLDPIYSMQFVQIGVLRADAYQKPVEQEYRDALSAFQKSIPGILDLYYIQSQIAILDKDYVKAIDILQKTIAMEPDVGVSYWRLAVVYQHQGKYKEMSEAIDKALERKFVLSDFGAVALAADGYFKAGRWDGRLKVLKIGAELEPNNAKVHAALAEAYLKTGDFQQARLEVARVLNIDARYIDQAKEFYKEIDAAELGEQDSN